MPCRFIPFSGPATKSALPHALALLIVSASPALTLARSPKVLISADLEGVAGVTSLPIQASPGGREYEQIRKLFTLEINAAVQGAIDAGAAAVLVVDGHGDMQNVDLELLDERAEIVRSWPRRLIMLEGIDQTFDAAVFLGYHEKEGTEKAVLPHTFSMALFRAIELNGKEVGEFELSAFAAGDLNVPVVFLSGDDAICRTARETIKGIETVVTKYAISFSAARLRNPGKVREEIRAGVKQGVLNRSRISPLLAMEPVTLGISYKSVVAADVVANLLGARRVDARTVAFEAKNALEASAVLAAVQLTNRAKDGSEKAPVRD